MLEVLIDAEEKQRRQNASRHEKGMKPREQYLEQCKARTNDKLQQLRELKEQNPTASQRKLAEMMGISKTQINRLIKQL